MRFLLAVIISIAGFPAAAAFDHDHAIYDQLLKGIVVVHGHQSSVDYRKLDRDPETLNRYIDEIESVSRDSYDRWDRDRQLAFLINAYNALTLKLVITHYPGIESIRDIGGLFSGPWDVEFFTLFGQSTTLDQLEHWIIRKNFDEPRIHFALNCASRGCPPLQPDAYVADRLDRQLEHATRQFLTDPERNRVNSEKQRLELSPLFKWYREDFVSAAGSVIDFVLPYITGDPDQRKRLQAEIKSIRFLDYDWDLNDTAGR